MDDDERLLRAIRDGDGESFGVLYDRTRGFLLTCVIAPRVGRTDADDVLSETYRTALEKIGTFEWRGVGVVRWLASIARRKTLERVRQRARAGTRDEALDPVFEVPDGVPSAEAEMIRREQLVKMKARVEETLSALPERYAEALRLRLVEGLERADCAARLAVSTATFDVVLHRATRAFQREWERA